MSRSRIASAAESAARSRSASTTTTKRLASQSTTQPNAIPDLAAELEDVSETQIDRSDEPSELPVVRPGCFSPAVVGRPDVDDRVAGPAARVVQQSPTGPEAQSYRPERFEHHFGGEDFGGHPLDAGGATATSESHIVIVGGDCDVRRPLYATARSAASTRSLRRRRLCGSTPRSAASSATGTS